MHTESSDLEGLSQGQKYLHSFSDSEAYHEQMELRYSPIHSTYLKPSVVYFSDHRGIRIGLEIRN